MTRPPDRWTADDLRRQDPAATEVWSTPRGRPLLERLAAFRFSEPFSPLRPSTRTLIVCGGGTFLDEAKAFKKDKGLAAALVAVPTLWGSGAETSPVVVLNRDGRKQIAMGPEYLPAARVVLGDFALTVPPDLARDACGDAWAHALEGFLSPLASPDLRREIAGTIQEMLALPLAGDPRWFDASAAACWGQARSSVGLVHGIAHTLEGPLATAQPSAGWGHARLCATFLFPVMTIQSEVSPKPRALFGEFGLDFSAVMAVLKELFVPARYQAAVRLLPEHWTAVLRDRCTRTNSVLVRPDLLERFTSFS